jgi:tetratricopeptide (TPR) repeat protein
MQFSERKDMRRAWLSVAGAALMATIVVAPACGEVGQTLRAHAVDDFSEAIRRNPRDPIAYDNRGMAYYAKGDLDRAIADFNEAIRLDPKDAVAYNNRGAAHGAKADAHLAIVYRTMIDDSNWSVPKAVFRFKNNGILHPASVDVDVNLALADFSEAVRLAPHDAIFHNHRGAAYGATGDLDRAIADFNEAIRLDAHYAEAFSHRCYALAIIGQAQRALGDCDESLRLRPNDAEAFDSRGLAQLERGQFDSAIMDYDSALKLHPLTASSLYGRGVAKFKTGDHAGGIADIAAAKAIQADIADQFSRIGILATE